MARGPLPTEAQRIEELLARSAVYRALSVLLRYPDANTAKWLVAREPHRLPEVLERLSAGGRLPDQARRLSSALDAAALPDLARQHERVFGHAVQGAAPPYELEYGEEHSHRQPQELGDIAAFYAAFGLSAAARAHERVDHVGTECEFLHCLLYKQACAVDAEAHEQAAVCGNAVQRFLADHLGRWGPAFALRLTRVAGDDWLGVVGELLLEWLSQECARMDVPLGSRDLPLRSPKEQEAAGCAACLPAQGMRAEPAGERRQVPGDRDV
jgi:TorA maturation chaperone TorD